MEYFNDDYCEIHFFEDVPCMYWKMKGSANEELYRKYVLNGVHFFKSKNIENANLRAIIDISEFTPNGDIDPNWVNNEIMPLIHIENGLRLIATITPKNEKAMAISNDFHEKVQEIHLIKRFDTVDEAKAWLKEDIESSGIIGNYQLFQ